MKKTIFLLLLALTSISHAVENKIAMGSGNASCGDYVRETNLRTIRDAWVTGYLSGLNADTRQIDVLRPEGVTANALSEATFLYCKNNPLEDLLFAANSVYFQLIRKYSPK